MNYAYICVLYNSPEAVKAAITTYAAEKKQSIDEYIIDEKDNKVNWEQRTIFSLINERCKSGDQLFVYEGSNLARSTKQILFVLKALAEKQVTLHLTKYNRVYPCGEHADTENFIRIMQNIESDFISKRTTDALAYKASGADNKKVSTYKHEDIEKHREDILSFLSKKISKAAIAKIIGCDYIALCNYIAKNNLTADK